MQKVFDVNLRLVYEGDVPAEQVAAAVELAVREHLDKGFLNNAGWMNDPELEHARCISATLAKPEVVIDMTDVFGMQFSASLPMEVVTIFKMISSTAMQQKTKCALSRVARCSVLAFKISPV